MKAEKTHFIVKLTELKPEHKVKLIKEVKNSIQGLNLVQVSVAFTDSCRKFVSLASDKQYFCAHSQSCMPSYVSRHIKPSVEKQVTTASCQNMMSINN